MARKRKKRRNPAKNHSGLGAFLGCLVGATPGAVARSYPVLVVGWIVGGGVGGAVGAKPDRRKRAAIGGALGGVLGPLGAALGGYIAGKKPDAKRKRNPAWVAPAVIVATVAAAGTATALVVKAAKKKKQLAAPEPDEPEETEDWRTKVDLEEAMPTTADFLMGWTAEPAGYDWSSGSEPDYQFAYRVLQLNAPTKTGREWVAVWSGANSILEFTRAWWPTRTRDDAYDKIAEALERMKS